MTNSNQNTNQTTRRAFLKTLIASSSAVALSTIPNKWEKSIIRVGSLPALAIISPTPIVITDAFISGRRGECDSGGGQKGTVYYIGMDYNASANDSVIVGETHIHTTLTYQPSNSTQTNEIPLDADYMTGTGQSGNIVVPVCVDFGTDTSASIIVSLTKPTSNEKIINIAP